MAIVKESIIKALSTVDDPDLKQDLVTLDMVKDIIIDGNNVSATINLTTPACPLKELIKNDCVKAINKEVPEAVVTIDFTANVTSNRPSSPSLPNVKNIIAVSSGKGGVGKSTVACNLAIALAKSGARVGLIDADIHGPSMPLMFGLENDNPGIVNEDGKNFVIPLRNYGVDLISIGFLMDPNDAVIWRGPMASSAIKQFINDVKWGNLDYLLIDLPPGTSDIHLTLVQSVPVTGAVVVTTPQKVALSDAQKGISLFKTPQINVSILGVIENMSYFTPAELPENKYYIFGKDGGKEMAEKNNLNFLGEIPIVESICEGGDTGQPAVLSDSPSAPAFEKLAEEVARQVAIRNANLEKTKQVELEA